MKMGTKDPELIYSQQQTCGDNRRPPFETAAFRRAANQVPVGLLCGGKLLRAGLLAKNIPHATARGEPSGVLAKVLPLGSSF